MLSKRAPGEGHRKGWIGAAWSDKNAVMVRVINKAEVLLGKWAMGKGAS